MLLGNGVITNKLPITNFGGVQCNTNWNRDEIILGLGSFDLKASMPDGYGLMGYEKAIVAGSLSSLVSVSSYANGSPCLGIDTTGTAQGTATVTGEGGLIVSGSGIAQSTSTVTGDIVASIYGDGSAIGTSTAYCDILFAYGYASGSCATFSACSLEPYAVVFGEGTTVDTSGLTPASIWSYGDRTLTSIDIEVSGLTVEEHNKLMSTSSKSDVYNASVI